MRARRLGWFRARCAEPRDGDLSDWLSDLPLLRLPCLIGDLARRARLPFELNRGEEIIDRPGQIQLAPLEGPHSSFHGSGPPHHWGSGRGQPGGDFLEDILRDFFEPFVMTGGEEIERHQYLRT